MQSPPRPPDSGLSDSGPSDSTQPEPVTPDLVKPDPQWTILKLLQWTTSYFKAHQIDSPRLTVEILLAHVLGVRRIDLYLRFEQPLTPGELKAFKALIRRRTAREPVAYITGSREFFGIDFDVAPGVLIPRPETEFLVEAALKKISNNKLFSKRILDIGTGSGAIIVSLAVNRPGHCFFASDKSETAIRIAAKNAQKKGVTDTIRFFVGSLFAPVKENSEPFDMILSNPPYIPESRIAGLEPEVRQFEPFSALDGGADGLAVIRQIIHAAPAFLKQNGIVMLEIGFDQRERVERMIRESGHYDGIEFVQDYAGYDRVVVMHKKM